MSEQTEGRGNIVFRELRDARFVLLSALNSEGLTFTQIRSKLSVTDGLLFRFMEDMERKGLIRALPGQVPADLCDSLVEDNGPHLSRWVRTMRGTMALVEYNRQKS